MLLFKIVLENAEFILERSMSVTGSKGLRKNKGLWLNEVFVIDDEGYILNAPNSYESSQVSVVQSHEMGID